MKTQQNSPMNSTTETVYFAGGCLWGVQEFMKHLPGVVSTEAGRANGTANTTNAPYDGYAECVKVCFNIQKVQLGQLLNFFFEIIDPYSVNKQGEDVGLKYRTGIYSEHAEHLALAKSYISQRNDSARIMVEILPLTHYVKSDAEHQDRLTHHPDDYCHIPSTLLHKYKSQ